MCNKKIMENLAVTNSNTQISIDSTISKTLCPRDGTVRIFQLHLNMNPANHSPPLTARIVSNFQPRIFKAGCVIKTLKSLVTCLKEKRIQQSKNDMFNDDHSYDGADKEETGDCTTNPQSSSKEPLCQSCTMSLGNSAYIADRPELGSQELCWFAQSDTLIRHSPQSDVQHRRLVGKFHQKLEPLN